MVILVEGPPRCGCSTLAAALASDLNLPLMKQPTLVVDVYYLQSEHAVVDRLHLTRYAVTGSHEGFEAIDSYLARQQSWLLALVDSPLAIENRLRPAEGHPQQHLTRAEIGTILARHNQGFQVSNIPNRGSFCLTQLIDPGRGDGRSEQYYSIVRTLRTKLQGEEDAKGV